MILASYRTQFREFHTILARASDPREDLGFWIEDYHTWSLEMQQGIRMEEIRRGWDIDRVWAGFLERWGRPVCFGGQDGPELARLRLVRQYEGDMEGGLDVKGLPTM